VLLVDLDVVGAVADLAVVRLRVLGRVLLVLAEEDDLEVFCADRDVAGARQPQPLAVDARGDDEGIGRFGNRDANAPVVVIPAPKVRDLRAQVFEVVVEQLVAEEPPGALASLPARHQFLCAPVARPSTKTS
jgi:hypothetical protein